MPKFFKGDKVRSKLTPGRIGEVLDCDNRCVYLRLRGHEEGKRGSGPQGTWTARPDNYELMEETMSVPRTSHKGTPKAAQEAPQAPQAVNPDWSYGEAARLHEALLKAANEYNTYIASKPTVQYYEASALSMTKAG